MMLTPELSICVRFARFSSNLRTPLSISSFSWLPSIALSPSMVDLPRRSNMVTSPDSRCANSRPTTPPWELIVQPYRIPFTFCSAADSPSDNYSLRVNRVGYLLTHYGMVRNRANRARKRSAATQSWISIYGWKARQPALRPAQRLCARGYLPGTPQIPWKLGQGDSVREAGRPAVRALEQSGPA